MNPLAEQYEKLPSIAKAILIIIAIIIVWMFYKRVSTQLKMVGQKLSSQGEISAFKANGEKLSYPISQYDSLADKLYNAMDGPGTWDDDVEDVFNSIKNNLDFLALRNAFGSRDGYSMQQWIDGDLSSSQKSEINSSLSAKGIQYRI